MQNANKKHRHTCEEGEKITFRYFLCLFQKTLTELLVSHPGNLLTVPLKECVGELLLLLLILRLRLIILLFF